MDSVYSSSSSSMSLGKGGTFPTGENEAWFDSGDNKTGVKFGLRSGDSEISDTLRSETCLNSCRIDAINGADVKHGAIVCDLVRPATGDSEDFFWSHWFLSVPGALLVSAALVRMILSVLMSSLVLTIWSVLTILSVPM